jgi:Family of unknown function (DUF5681)
MVTNPPDDDAPAPPPPSPANSRSKGGRFQKGQRSANPAGKRKGTRSRKTIWIEELMAGDIEAVVAKVCKKAKDGDMTAAKMILDRISPPRKGRAAPFALPAIVIAADVVAALAAVTAAMSAGKISPAEAVEIAAVIETARRAIETQDVETRLHALEERFK